MALCLSLQLRRSLILARAAQRTAALDIRRIGGADDETCSWLSTPVLAPFRVALRLYTVKTALVGRVFILDALQPLLFLDAILLAGPLSAFVFAPLRLLIRFDPVLLALPFQIRLTDALLPTLFGYLRSLAISLLALFHAAPVC